MILNFFSRDKTQEGQEDSLRWDFLLSKHEARKTIWSHVRSNARPRACVNIGRRRRRMALKVAPIMRTHKPQGLRLVPSRLFNSVNCFSG